MDIPFLLLLLLVCLNGVSFCELAVPGFRWGRIQGGFSKEEEGDSPVGKERGGGEGGMDRGFTSGLWELVVG